MKANELREGNWVVGALNQPVQVKAWQIANYSDTYSPIYLTPEILQKAGFEDSPVIAAPIYFRKGNITAQFLNDGRVAFTFSEMRNEVKICFRKYVHQLQNLFFALTDEELEIKL